MHTESWVIDLDENGGAAYLECRVGVHKTITSAYHHASTGGTFKGTSREQEADVRFS